MNSINLLIEIQNMAILDPNIFCQNKISLEFTRQNMIWKEIFTKNASILAENVIKETIICGFWDEAKLFSELL